MIIDEIDKKSWGQILVIIGGFILSQTIIKEFLNLADGKIEPWVLPAFSIAIIFAGVELMNNIKHSWYSYVNGLFLLISIVLIVLVKSNVINGITFLWLIFIVSLISILSTIIYVINKPKRNK